MNLITHSLVMCNPRYQTDEFAIFVCSLWGLISSLTRESLSAAFLVFCPGSIFYVQIGTLSNCASCIIARIGAKCDLDAHSTINSQIMSPHRSHSALSSGD